MAFVKFDRGLFRNGNSAKGLSYGQIEPNQVWFDRAGMVEAQCKLDTVCFSDDQVAPSVISGLNPTATVPVTTPTNKIVAQVGAFLEVNKGSYTATIPTTTGKAAGMPVGINYSTEKLYDQFNPQRRKFFLTTNDWLPRIGYVERGMRITTNTVQWDTTYNGPDVTIDKDLNPATGTNGREFSVADFSGFTSTDDSLQVWQAVQQIIAQKGIVYAAVRDGSDGELVIGITPDPTKDIILAEVVAAYTNADRTCSFMFQILDGGTK